MEQWQNRYIQNVEPKLKVEDVDDELKTGLLHRVPLSLTFTSMSKLLLLVAAVTFRWRFTWRTYRYIHTSIWHMHCMIYVLTQIMLQWFRICLLLHHLRQLWPCCQSTCGTDRWRLVKVCPFCQSTCGTDRWRVVKVCNCCQSTCGIDRWRVVKVCNCCQ